MEKYRVLETIGEGSFGKVYRGRRKFSGQFVALKVCCPVSAAAAPVAQPSALTNSNAVHSKTGKEKKGFGKLAARN